jgi:hypothetical protein
MTTRNELSFSSPITDPPASVYVVVADSQGSREQAPPADPPAVPILLYKQRGLRTYMCLRLQVRAIRDGSINWSPRLDQLVHRIRPHFVV